RRVVIAPAMVVATTLLLAAAPFILLVAAFGVRYSSRRWRLLRLAWFFIVYIVRESVGLCALAFLWVVSGFGWKLSSERFQEAHYSLMGWYLRGLINSASRVLGLKMVDETRGASLNDVDGPILLFSRHAGAGDSFILVHVLLNQLDRRPRIVLKDLLQFDPCIDVVLNRIPTRFISPNPPQGSGVTDSIRELAGGLDDKGALVLFPEGGNFTERRRTRAIEKLSAAGLDASAEKARGLTHLLPPRPGGAFAAIDAAPDADVVFVAHTGLEQLSSLQDLWKGLPMDRDVRLHWWREPNKNVPTDPGERITWLYEWWERIDDWIDERKDPELPTYPKLIPAQPEE
ncbi:MAG TPA: 1-acyl-sn-glycerol-3-phosphate acyltransferase, partial [Microthrixaceae bacterium]|nr:1-acyl-sn-glycerol-3-phosphate acyltransferase [Microthrixaceae bacterium]